MRPDENSIMTGSMFFIEFIELFSLAGGIGSIIGTAIGMVT
jgi:hypothetical protein